jgi:hypothetical protein
LVSWLNAKRISSLFPGVINKDKKEIYPLNKKKSTGKNQVVTPTQSQRSTVFEQPHTLPIHLPTPGNLPAWPFQKIGQWRIDVNKSVEAWRHGMKIWRKEHLTRIGYDDAEYKRKELFWSQSVSRQSNSDKIA